ncbi:MAG: NYN domain-containing protein [Patescibacteria group bacterium]
MSTNKALVLIDGSNVYFAQKIIGKQLDWVKVLDYFRKSNTLINIKYYAGVRKGNSSADGFFKKLRKINIQVITKEVKTVMDGKGGTYEKCNFDVEIAVDAVNAKDKYDTLIL